VRDKPLLVHFLQQIDQDHLRSPAAAPPSADGERTGAYCSRCCAGADLRREIPTTDGLDKQIA
jgi:hypothetical protein